jgi:4-hydroxy-4-methyl-2-oxoglutarate aldolase
MIEEPPPIVFATPADRPSTDVIERFRSAPTSFIVDAMNGTGALDWRIKPLVGRSLLGVALTCDCGPLDNLAFMAALAECRPGDVLVVATGGYVGAAVTGDLLMYVARNRGAAGFVTDGLVRDLDDLETVGLPTFAMGVTPNFAAKARSRLCRPADRMWRRGGRLGRCGGRRSRRRGRRPARPHIGDAGES